MTLDEIKDKLGKEEMELYNNLKDRNWRLNNLYYIKDKHGKKILFRPNPEQLHLLENMHFFNVILKARQLGITTFFCIFYLDQILFSENKTAGIVAHTQNDARRFFRDKVKFAWDNLNENLKDTLGPPDTNTAGELSFPNGGKIFVSTSTRSSTLQFLHISEFGKICAQYPVKADEIISGSINTVEAGNFVSIESTAEGSDGHFYDICERARKYKEQGKPHTPLDFKLFFYPWWVDKTYSLSGPITIDKEHEEYFNKLLIKERIILTPEQKNWYIKKHATLGDAIFREYPSTYEEAFASSVEGAYYRTQMLKVREQGRIMNVPFDSTYLVDTWWDLGMNDTNVIIFTQAAGNEIRFIDYYENTGEGLAHYINILKEKGYLYGTHTFPHDINVRELGTGVSRLQTLQDLKLTGIRTIERSKDINDDIEAVRRVFSRFYFDERNCKTVIEACDNYRKEKNAQTGEFMNSPRHDKYSHTADALRVLARGWQKHHIEEVKGKATMMDFF